MSPSPIARSVALGLAVIASTVSTVACGTPGGITMRRSPCAAQSDERPGNALVRCSEHSVAYVETEEASGTGVAIKVDTKRYILTNAHVVDPFADVAITLDGKRHEEIPVVGVDATADIAVIGPLDERLATVPVDLGAAATPRRGDDVYLVGYPGEAPPDDPKDLETTIAAGIVSRFRTIKAFDQTYVQTDAAIAGGQSGGPLFDAKGDLLGISGLSFADKFALALSSDDVAVAVKRIIDGKGDAYPRVPVRASADLPKSGDIGFADGGDGQVLFVPSDDTDRQLDFEVTGGADVVVAIESRDEGRLIESSNAADVATRLDQLIAAAYGDDTDSIDPTDPSFGGLPLDDGETGEGAGDNGSGDSGAADAPAAAEVAPGHFTASIAAGDAAQIRLDAPLTAGAIKVHYTSSLPVFPLTHQRSERALSVNDSADAVMNRFESGNDYLVTLAPGQKAEVRAESPQADVGVTVFDPGVVLDPVVANDPWSADGVEDVDDSGEGLYGADAVTVIGDDAGGTYRLRLYSNEGLTVGGRLSVVDCVKVDCRKAGR